MKNIYKTLKEVHEELDQFDEIISGAGRPPVDRTVFKIFNFECLHNYCKTSLGWVASFEDCCPYCVRAIINNYGSREDKIKFNELHNLGAAYQIPVTRKEITLHNKLKRGRNKCNRKAMFKPSRKKYERLLRGFKKAGITHLRKTKLNLYEGLFGFIIMNRDHGHLNMDDFYIHIPNTCKSNRNFQCVRSEKELLKEVQVLFKTHTKIPPPSNLDEVIFIRDNIL